MFDIHQKYKFLRVKFGVCKSNPIFTVNCELCSKKIFGQIEAWKTGTIRKLTHDGAFHHIDGNKNHNNPNNIILLCYNCHKRLHQLGVILRWLNQIGKTVENFPNAIELNAIRFK